MTQPPDSDGHPERGPERDPGSRDPGARGPPLAGARRAGHRRGDARGDVGPALRGRLHPRGERARRAQPVARRPRAAGCVAGAQFAAIALVFTQLISLGQTVVVARLLTPAEIGIFTLGTLLANFAVTIADGGMRAALIQREEDVEKATETAFWASLITGVVMSGAALAAAPLLGMFFSSEMVGLVCAATCGTLLIHSLVNVPEALLQRRFNFKRRLIVDPLTAGTFAVVTVAFAFAGFGVWGMVIGLYASQLATLISCWVMCKWRPGKTRPSYRMWRELAGFSFPLIVSNLTDKSRELVQSTLIGRGLGEGGAGQYRYGRRIGVLPGHGDHPGRVLRAVPGVLAHLLRREAIPRRVPAQPARPVDRDDPVLRGAHRPRPADDRGPARRAVATRRPVRRGDGGLRARRGHERDRDGVDQGRGQEPAHPHPHGALGRPRRRRPRPPAAVRPARRRHRGLDRRGGRRVRQPRARARPRERDVARAPEPAHPADDRGGRGRGGRRVPRADGGQCRPAADPAGPARPRRRDAPAARDLPRGAAPHRPGVRARGPRRRAPPREVQGRRRHRGRPRPPSRTPRTPSRAGAATCSTRPPSSCACRSWSTTSPTTSPSGARPRVPAHRRCRRSRSGRGLPVPPGTGRRARLPTARSSTPPPPP